MRCSSEPGTVFPLIRWRNIWTCNLSRLAEDKSGFRPRFSFIVTMVYLCLRVQNFWSSVPERRFKKIPSQDYNAFFGQSCLSERSWSLTLHHTLDRMLWTQTGLEEEEEVCVSGGRLNHTRPAVVTENLSAEIYMIKYIFDEIKCMSIYSKFFESSPKACYMYLSCFPVYMTWCCNLFNDPVYSVNFTVTSSMPIY